MQQTELEVPAIKPRAYCIWNSRTRIVRITFKDSASHRQLTSRSKQHAPAKVTEEILKMIRRKGTKILLELELNTVL